jgi:outer membrane protein OmpA-like peptidoglycan-associated protein
MTSKFYRNMITGLALLMPVVCLGADYDARVFRGEVPTEQQLIDALRPESKLKFRNIRPETEEIKPKAVSMDLIIFEFNSYELTEQSKNVLKIVGNALTSQDLKDEDVLIQGHTDSAGSDSYNKVLSEKRAMAVKDYLVHSFNMDPMRFKTVGMGESELLNKKNPLSAENRRVVFSTQSN